MLVSSRTRSRYAVFIRVHNSNFTTVNYHVNFGGYGNLQAVYRLIIWLYRLPPECITGKIFFYRLPIDNYRRNRKNKNVTTVCRNNRHSVFWLPPTKITAGMRYHLPGKKYTFFKTLYRLSDPYFTRRSEADRLSAQAIRMGSIPWRFSSYFFFLFFFFFFFF